MRLANVRMASGSPGRATGTAPIASAPKCRKWAAASSTPPITAGSVAMRLAIRSEAFCAWRTSSAAAGSNRRTSARLRERARPVERRPSGSIRAVRHEKRQQPPLDAERYARGRRGRAGREPDGERFAEERLVIVERRGRRSSRPPEGQDELVLERFQLLQHRLAPRRGREERVARLHD